MTAYHTPHPREIKSFVKRQRKLTPRQQAAFSHGFEIYNIALNQKPLDFNLIFGRQAPRVLEIGFGNGETLVSMAKAHPEWDFVGIEVHTPGIANLLIQLITEDIHNVRMIEADAQIVLQEYILDHAFSRVHIFFPDPWPKKRHHKRRLIQSDFVRSIQQKLTINGVLHCATDWENYAHQMMAVLSNTAGFQNMIGEDQFADNSKLSLRANTKFEKRGVRLGHRVFDLLFKNVSH